MPHEPTYYRTPFESRDLLEEGDQYITYDPYTKLEWADAGLGDKFHTNDPSSLYTAAFGDNKIHASSAEFLVFLSNAGIDTDLIQPLSTSPIWVGNDDYVTQDHWPTIKSFVYDYFGLYDALQSGGNATYAGPDDLPYFCVMTSDGMLFEGVGLDIRTDHTGYNAWMGVQIDEVYGIYSGEYDPGSPRHDLWLETGGEYAYYRPENLAPTAINLSNSNIAEKSNGAVVGILSVSDTDTNDTHTLSLSGSHGFLFEVSNNQLKLRSGVSADYETQSFYSVTVTATDSGGLSKSQDFTIGVNGSPTAINLSNSNIAEKSYGAVVGTLNVSDPNTGDTHTLTLSGYHAGLFEINGDNQLKLVFWYSADYETQSSYSVTITATDSGGLNKSQDFTIAVTDINEQLVPQGTTGNDKLTGFSGIEILDGGGGVDRVDYSLLKSYVSFSLNADGQIVIQGSTDQSDTLTSVERIHFADTVYALDTEGNAGIAAKAIIVTFGSDGLSAYMSAALSVVDSGTSLEALCDLVVDLKLIDQLTGSSSNSSFVGHLFKNVVGRSPNLLENALYTNQLDNGTYTKSSLLALAANTTLTENLLTANSVDLIGVPGSADGEILALQYDIGLG
jgi:hypothetical protein